MPAIAIALFAGVTLAVAELASPDRVARYIPSATAMGLGFVIPAWNSISLFLGALGAVVALSALRPREKAVAPAAEM